MSLLNVNKIAPQSGTDFTLGDSGDTFTVPSGATLTVAGTFTQTGAQTFDGGVDIDNFNINGSEIDLSSGDLTVDVAGDIILDADGGEVLFHDATTAMGHISMASSNITLKSLVSDKDIIFQGNDGGAGITALTLDMSAAGAATFNNNVTVGDNLNLTTDSSVVAFGADSDTTLTHTDGTGLTLNSTNKLCFNDATQFVQGISATVLGLGATDEIDLTATAVDLNGTLDVSGTSQFNGLLTIKPGSNVNQLKLEQNNATDYWALHADSSGGPLSFNRYTGGAETEELRIVSGKISTGAEDSPDVTPGGLCLNQEAEDSNILTFKSSDVAHGITNEIQTDTFGTFLKRAGATGGLHIKGFCEDVIGLQLQGYVTTADTDKNSSANGAVVIRANIKSGVDAAVMTSNGNLLAVQNGSNNRFIVDAEGDTHSDGSASTYDAYEDAQLVRAFDLSHGKGVINSKFDKFVSYNHEHLADLKLVGREKDGTPNHMINNTGMMRLHNGAIWQQYEKHNQLLDAVYELAKESIGEKKAKAILEKHEIKRLN